MVCQLTISVTSNWLLVQLVSYRRRNRPVSNFAIAHVRLLNCRYSGKLTDLDFLSLEGFMSGILPTEMYVSGSAMT
jgi:hypothetical protein